MATVITAGNATNGLSFTADNTGALEFKTGTGAGTTALTLSSSQIATFAGSVAGATGTLYPLTSGTSVTASGTSIDFTSIPSWVKRITVMFNGVSISGTSAPLIQIGSGSVTNSGYVSSGFVSTSFTGNSSTAGFVVSFGSGLAAATVSGNLVLTLISNNTWTGTGVLANTASALFVTTFGGVSPNLSGALDRVRITTVNGTDTFDAGSINILYE